ncbi:hypothetical protein GcM3_215008 [Golovinomyces cichoracearum]|uniref:HhH-GPD domain-containing protein n=1 Tax=Golovinomyces cichoracearum TaxID=62708 RepID=A0A420H8U6_9PEZI|nr:hypothetical protein GcM3_215008 [Golovinomyces cichoracearum]
MRVLKKGRVTEKNKKFMSSSDPLDLRNHIEIQTAFLKIRRGQIINDLSIMSSLQDQIISREIPHFSLFLSPQLWENHHELLKFKSWLEVSENTLQQICIYNDLSSIKINLTFRTKIEQIIVTGFYDATKQVVNFYIPNRTTFHKILCWEKKFEISRILNYNIKLGCVSLESSSFCLFLPKIALRMTWIFVAAKSLSIVQARVLNDVPVSRIIENSSQSLVNPNLGLEKIRSKFLFIAFERVEFLNISKKTKLHSNKKKKDLRIFIDSWLLFNDGNLAIDAYMPFEQISSPFNVVKNITYSSKFENERSAESGGVLTKSSTSFKDNFSPERYRYWILDNSLHSFAGSLLIQESTGINNDIPINDEATQTFEVIEEQPVKNHCAKTRAKRAPARSPYFNSPSRPLKRRKVMSEVKAESKKMYSRIVYSPLFAKVDNDLWSQVPRTPSRQSPATISCIPFPPLSHMYFGLIQEKLVEQPFRLLIAITFLIRTHGKHAIPVYHMLMSRYPTPESLLAADREDIVSIVRHLGFQNQRARTFQEYASIWLENPPAKDKRYAVRGYPNHDSGRDIKKGEVLTDSDKREAWEIGHMTSGTYTLDSWRIFCRDKLRGVAVGWNGEGACEGFQPEWMRVLPQDKELRAFIKWMWLKEGFEWNPLTGETDVASTELIIAALEGRLVWDEENGLRRI